MKKRNVIEWAMHYRQIVLFIACCLIAFGIYALGHINKNEFPDFTVRQGIVAAVYPGASAEDIEEQVTRPLEEYIFSYKEVKKSDTKSYSRDGLVIVQVELNDDVTDKEAFWNKFKHGVAVFKNELPSGVLAMRVMDDFGDTSSLLITMSSKDKTYREMNDYMKALQDSLRTIESIGRMSVMGLQKEQISVYLDNEKLAHYGIGDRLIALRLMQKGFVTMAGTQKSDRTNAPIYVNRSLNAVQDVENMIVYSDPTGNSVRLGDIARIVREYPEPSAYVTNNGTKCLVLSVEVKKGRNITQMGSDINEKLANIAPSLPKDVQLFKITDQAKVVGDSIVNFIKELLIAVIAVVVVVLLLLPFRVALVAASTIPITIFISLGFFYAFGIELNTVTLAALIVTLGMIVDNSIVIIDSYLEKISEGQSRWHASIESATHFFKSIFSATLAISITFFPFLLFMTGMFHDFLLSFPWAITLVLMVSLLVAELIVPFLQFFFIRRPMPSEVAKGKKKKFSFLDKLQSWYNFLLKKCFAHPYITLCIGLLSIVLGGVGYALLPKRLLPTADRNQFAVEISLPTGTALPRTTAIADSLEHLLRKDERVVSVAAFKGCSSPRFHTAYAPQFAGTNYAQFIVNTTSIEATESVLADYREKYANAFPGAYVRFKQLSYAEEAFPIEVRISGHDLSTLQQTADSLTAILRTLPQLRLVRNDLTEPLLTTEIKLNEEAASRLGITNLDVEMATALRYNSDGYPLGTIWNGDYDMDIRLKSDKANRSTLTDLANEQVGAYAGIATVPLRQVATLSPAWHIGQIPHRNGLRTVSIQAEIGDKLNAAEVTKMVQQRLATFQVPKDVQVTYGGTVEKDAKTNPKIATSLACSIVIIFFILIGHFKRVSTAVLLLCSLPLILIGTAIGVGVMGIDFSVTCTLGVISLMGILVRNAIIMYDYAEELRKNERLTAHQAIYLSAQRRMRPIFLTSAAASMGVIPMILGGSGLWMPMGAVICFGTLITMVLILTVLPVAYWIVMSGSTRRRQEALALENE